LTWAFHQQIRAILCSPSDRLTGYTSRTAQATLPPSEVEDPATLSDAEKARRAKLLINQRATPVPASWG